ncbi:MAG: (2Fe-2S)-binding protein [Rhizobiales bacterium]|nr:(2Fe-2S)-binding protein [Hyphomicrobiales bacterium]
MTTTNTSARIDSGIQRGAQFRITIDGESIIAFEGETVAAALIAAGHRTLRYSTKRKEPRSLYCGIGVCQECRMMIDGVINTRACMTPARAGMTVKTQHGIGEY